MYAKGQVSFRRYADKYWRCQSTLLLLFFCLAFLPFDTAHASLNQQGSAPPRPIADSATTDKNSSVTIDVLANDLSDGGGSLVIAAVSNPPAGTATIVDNKIRYTPDANFTGLDNFFYVVHNGNPIDSRQAVVVVNVRPVDNPISDILLSNDTVAENSSVVRPIGKFTAVGGQRFHKFLAGWQQQR